MADILVVSDAATVIDDVRAALEDEGTTVRSVHSGEAVRRAVDDEPPDLVITDMQVGNMGGIAICMDLRLEESGGRLPHVPVLILMDRRADVFLARRSDAEGWLVKPFDSLRLRRAVRALLAGGTFHDESYRPLPLPAELRN
ncbi:MAG TPA: response regulator [Acidimicrobiales bacterium]|nr:response regulator [Acidimicrobiales bacterium]